MSPTLLLDLRLEAGYTFAPFGDTDLADEAPVDTVGVLDGGGTEDGTGALGGDGEGDL